jgi:hypothetical protein
LFLTLLCGTLPLLILTRDISTLFLRLLFALSLLVQALLPLLLPTLLAFLTVRLLRLATMLRLLPTLLLLSRLFASGLCLLRWAGRLPFFATALSLLLSLFSLGLVFLASLLTSTTSPLSIGKVGGAQ